MILIIFDWIRAPGIGHKKTLISDARLLEGGGMVGGGGGPEVDFWRMDLGTFDEWSSMKKDLSVAR